MERKVCILHVDDDPDDRDFFREVVERIDPDIICLQTDNGPEALRLAASVPDVIFLDINMPGMNGLECLQRLRENARLKNTPIIMHSTAFRDSEIKECLELGASDYLRKDATLADLSASLLTIFRKLVFPAVQVPK